MKYALGTAAVSSILWTALRLMVPNVFIRIFMVPTAGVLKIVPAIFRCYGISFLLLPLNIFSTYYFMQILKDAGIVKVRKEGTYVYYYLDPGKKEIEKMIDLFSDIQRIMRNVPDRSGEDWSKQSTDWEVER